MPNGMKLKPTVPKKATVVITGTGRPLLPPVAPPRPAPTQARDAASIGRACLKLLTPRVAKGEDVITCLGRLLARLDQAERTLVALANVPPLTAP